MASTILRRVPPPSRNDTTPSGAATRRRETGYPAQIFDAEISFGNQ
jgi:hypothetical protein